MKVGLLVREFRLLFVEVGLLNGGACLLVMKVTSE